MHPHSDSGLKYYTFGNLDEAGIHHGVFTRLGGVSPSPWDTLNLGGTVGDDREHIITNRERLFEVFKTPVSSLYDVWQVHSSEMKFANVPRPLDQPHEKADIIATKKVGITLFMRFADCVPIFFYDPVEKVIAIAHAGWIGTLNGIAQTAVEGLHREFGSKPSDLMVGIGPSIGPDHYQVGDEVIQKVEAKFGSDAEILLHNSEGKIQLDLWKTNELILQKCGVRQIEIAGICTACDLSEWFSHRGEKGKTGRFAALMTL